MFGYVKNIKRKQIEQEFQGKGNNTKKKGISNKSPLLDFDFANMFLIQKNKHLSNLNTSQSIVINSGSRYPNRLTVDRSWFKGNDFEIHRFHDRIDYGTKMTYCPRNLIINSQIKSIKLTQMIFN